MATATKRGIARPGNTPLHARGPGTERAVAMARGGMVATNHPLATAAGLWALQRGGNATDAALAAAGVCAVVLPAMCGLGGDCFILHYDAKTGAVTSVNGSGAAPMTATPEAYRERGHIAQMPLDGPLSVGVPGAVHAWYAASERWGAIEMSDLLRPAEEYARQGFPLTPDGAYITAAEMGRLRAQPGDAAKTYLQDGRTAPHTGQLLRNEPLADTFRLLRRGGAKAFYTGETAAKIGAWMAKNGGLLDGGRLRAPPQRDCSRHFDRPTVGTRFTQTRPCRRESSCSPCSISSPAPISRRLGRIPRKRCT